MPPNAANTSSVAPSKMQQKFTVRRQIFSKDSSSECFSSSVGSSNSSLNTTNHRLPRRSSSGRLDAKTCSYRRRASAVERKNQSSSGLRRSKRSACLVSEYSSGSLSIGGQETSMKNATFSRPPSPVSSETSMFTDGSGSSPDEDSVTRFDATMMLKALQDKHHGRTFSVVRFDAPRRPSTTIPSSSKASSSFLPHIPIEEETWGHFADVNDEEDYGSQPLGF